METKKVIQRLQRTSKAPKAIGLIEEDTKTSTNPTTESSETSHSFFGSVSEGHSSILVQQIPIFKKGAATKLPSASDALFQAIDLVDMEWCRQLLESSEVSVNAKPSGDMSALHVASMRGLLKICEVLLDYGQEIDINIRTSMLQTPLHLACLHNQLSVAQLLVRSGAQLNPLDISNNLPLHYAVQNGDAEFLQWFISKRPDFSVENRYGQTPLDMAPNENVRIVVEEHSQKARNPAPYWGEPQTIQIDGKLNPYDFEPIGVLGRGSFGEVYLVRKIDSRKLYAMKILKKDRIMQQNLVKYAMTERNVLSYLRHPFIVSLNYAFQTADRLFLILDYCPGRDLASHLQRERRFPEQKARMYLCEIVLAIEELHRRDIIFRDLKPENVVLDAQGHAMLTDFGLSKEGVFDNYTARSFCGSLAYLAPEMIKRKGHGKSVDWYLLGVLFYEMLIGVPPYYSSKKEELFHNIQKGKLKVPKTMSQEAKDLLKDLLRRDPHLRLGAKRDAEEIKEHNYFRGINWNTVLRREVRMPIPSVAPDPEIWIDPRLVYGCTEGTEGNRISGWTFVSE